MWQLLPLLLITIVPTSSSPADVAPVCTSIKGNEICKTSSGALVSYRPSSSSIYLNTTAITAIGDSAFKNDTVRRLVLSSTRHEYSIDEANDTWFCLPSTINITPESFIGLPSLETVMLRCMELPTAHDIFKYLPSVHNLALIANKFTAFPRQLCASLPNLRHLTVVNQRLPQLSSESFAGINGDLQGISFYSNQLQSIGASTFAGFPNLRSIWLTDNHLEVLRPDMFDGVRRLIALKVAKNRLKKILPGTFSNMPDLLAISLADNLLEHLPNGIFNGLKSLMFLNLYGNSIATVPYDLFQGLDSLEDLSFGFHADCEIETDAFRGLRLASLSLDADQLSGLRAEAFNGLSTGWLSLRRNNTLNFKPNLFKGLTVTDKITIFESRMSVIRKEDWGIGKDVVMYSSSKFMDTLYET